MDNTRSQLIADQESDKPYKKQNIMEKLTTKRSYLQQQLDKLDRQINLISENPVIKEYFELDN